MILTKIPPWQQYNHRVDFMRCPSMLPMPNPGTAATPLVATDAAITNVRFMGGLNFLARSSLAFLDEP